MARNRNYNPYDLQAEDIGDPRKRQAARRQQQAIDQAYWDRRGGRPGTVTVTNSDNLNTLSANNGTTPEGLLAANPDVNQIKTGMVLNVPGYHGDLGFAPRPPSPVPGSEAWRAQNTGGVGLPSAGPLGSTSGYYGYQGNPGYAPISTFPRPRRLAFQTGSLSAPRGCL